MATIIIIILVNGGKGPDHMKLVVDKLQLISDPSSVRRWIVRIGLNSVLICCCHRDGLIRHPSSRVCGCILEEIFVVILPYRG